jgi:hypothetical protein
MSATSSEALPFTDGTKIGEYAAQQPLSGVDVIVQAGAVNSHGGFVIMPKPESTESSLAR